MHSLINPCFCSSKSEKVLDVSRNWKERSRAATTRVRESRPCPASYAFLALHFSSYFWLVKNFLDQSKIRRKVQIKRWRHNYSTQHCGKLADVCVWPLNRVNDWQHQLSWALSKKEAIISTASCWVSDCSRQKSKDFEGLVTLSMTAQIPNNERLPHSTD